MSPVVVNVVVVGDTDCGKTSLLTTFFKGRHRDDVVPNFDDYVTLGMDVDGESVALELRDTVSSEACRRFRLFWYMGSHVVILCFSIDSPTSLRNVPDDWMPELRRICPDVPVILVGNKKDVRGDLGVIERPSPDNVLPVSVEDCKAMSVAIRAKDYIECSAVTGENVQRLFEIAARAGLEKVKNSTKTKYMIDTLGGSRRSLDICIHLLTSIEIAMCLIEAHRRGVIVRIICDNEMSTNKGSQVRTLSRAGIPVKIPLLNYHMHCKFAVIDGWKVMTGSVNWTVQGIHGNWDNLVVTSQPDLVRETLAGFDIMWNNPQVQMFC